MWAARPENPVTPQPQVAFARRATRSALAIGGAYAAVGFGWILLSDALMQALWPDPAALALAQRYKGLLYVGVTALGLVLLLKASYQRMLRAVHAARSSELQVNDLFLNHPEPMWIHDAQKLRILRVNAAATRHYGWPEADFLAMTLHDLQSPDGAPSGGNPDMACHRKRSGERLFVQVTAHGLPCDGRPAVMVLARDVTRDVLARHALVRQEAQYRQLHQSLGEVLWLARADGREMFYVSPAAETVYGVPAAQLLQDPDRWMRAVHPEDLRTALDSARQLAEQGHAECEYRICRPDGSTRWISDRKKLIRDDEGLVTMVGGIAEDITLQKAQDHSRAAMQAELERLVAERTAELERLNSELDAFTRTAAHDLKSPLNAIAGFANLLQRRFAGPLGDEGLRMAARIERSARDMAGLVNDLLGLSRVSTLDLQPRPVDLAPMVRAIVDDLHLQDPDRRVALVVPDALHVHCDEGLVRSLLLNLLGNAWKFSARRPAAHITVRQHAVAGGRQISIEDNGAGFDARQAVGLFKPFQRFHGTADFSGTGIGLATCQRIVQRHGGQIWLRSAPDRGTTVCFTLPDAPHASAQPRPACPEAKAQIQAAEPASLTA